jgi:hypothetical protein
LQVTKYVQDKIWIFRTDFCQPILHRSFNKNLQEECHDALHFRPKFHSEKNMNAGLLYDFNVIRPPCGRFYIT